MQKWLLCAALLWSCSAFADEPEPDPPAVGMSCSPTITFEIEGKQYKHMECTPLYKHPPLQGHEQIPVRWRDHSPTDKLKVAPKTQAQALPP